MASYARRPALDFTTVVAPNLLCVLAKSVPSRSARLVYTAANPEIRPAAPGRDDACHRQLGNQRWFCGRGSSTPWPVRGPGRERGRFQFHCVDGRRNRRRKPVACRQRVLTVVYGGTN